MPPPRRSPRGGKINGDGLLHEHRQPGCHDQPLPAGRARRAAHRHRRHPAQRQADRRRRCRSGYRAGRRHRARRRGPRRSPRRGRRRGSRSAPARWRWATPPAPTIAIRQVRIRKPPGKDYERYFCSSLPRHTPSATVNPEYERINRFVTLHHPTACRWPNSVTVRSTTARRRAADLIRPGGVRAALEDDRPARRRGVGRPTGPAPPTAGRCRTCSPPKAGQRVSVVLPARNEQNTVGPDRGDDPRVSDGERATGRRS